MAHRYSNICRSTFPTEYWLYTYSRSVYIALMFLEMFSTLKGIECTPVYLRDTWVGGQHCPKLHCTAKGLCQDILAYESVVMLLCWQSAVTGRKSPEQGNTSWAKWGMARDCHKFCSCSDWPHPCATIVTFKKRCHLAKCVCWNQ